MTDRYLRTGPGQVPQVYPGTLAGINKAMAQAQLASRSAPGGHRVEAVTSGRRTLVHVYESGIITYLRSQAETVI